MNNKYKTSELIEFINLTERRIIGEWNELDEYSEKAFKEIKDRLLELDNRIQQDIEDKKRWKKLANL